MIACAKSATFRDHRGTRPCAFSPFSPRSSPWPARPARGSGDRGQGGSGDHDQDGASLEACLKAGQEQKQCQPPLLLCLKEQAASPKAAPVRFAGGDGSSQSVAVLVEAKTQKEGVLAEDLWALKHHDTWRRTDRALIRDAGRAFDKVGYDTPEGDRELWFDITSFAGKM